MATETLQLNSSDMEVKIVRIAETATLKKWFGITMALVAVGSLIFMLYEWRVSTLIQQLKDEDTYVRQGAIGMLGEMRSSRAVEPLIEILKKFGDQSNQSAAVYA